MNEYATIVKDDPPPQKRKPDKKPEVVKKSMFSDEALEDDMSDF